MADKPKWHHIATRLDDPERDELEAYRIEHGLKSLNTAVRHWLQGRRASRGRPEDAEALHMGGPR